MPDLPILEEGFHLATSGSDSKTLTATGVSGGRPSAFALGRGKGALMRRYGLAMLLAAGSAGPALAQEPYIGSSSFGSQETLYRYDDQEPWKHGWKKQMPYHEGYQAFRPYNYHHVFGQTQTAAAYGQSMPYSQQWWHRYQSVSAQYNHLQGQPPMAMPQYNGGPAPVQSPGMMPPNPYGPPHGSYGPAPGSYPAPPGSYELPPAPMNIDPAYTQPGTPTEPMTIPAMPAPLMPVN
jgi:hypothetical protein